jgi:DNA-binding NtrC family response regulator
MASRKDDVPLGALGELIGFSAPMQRVYSAIHKATAYGYPVLLIGERGTGKEAAAHSIHALGPRKNTPFVSLDCSAIAPTLFEPELFGYAKSAFAGASQPKWGLLALAGDGTLFLDEIAALPRSLQAKLLHVLEDGVFKPIGSTTPFPFKARLITSSRSELQTLVKRGVFLQELYLRLSVKQITLPPLRERRSDIPLLVDSFIEKYSTAESPVEFSVAAMSYLLAYNWPGNVRELESAVRHCVSAANGPVMGVEELNLVLGEKSRASVSTKDIQIADEQERSALLRALRDSGGDQAAAATRLGMGRTTFSRRLKYYGLGPAAR